MKSYESIQEAVDGKTVDHAKNLHLSTSTVNKWQEPSTDFTDSGAFNPVDRIEAIIAKSLALGTDRKRALAPHRYLSERFNIISIPMPDLEGIIPDEVSKEFYKMISEFAHVTKETADALKDNQINPREAKKIEKELWDLIRQAALYLYSLKKIEK
jgi:hypothetical protein